MKSLNLEIVHVKKEEALKMATFPNSSAPSQVKLKVCCLAKFSTFGTVQENAKEIKEKVTFFMLDCQESDKRVNQTTTPDQLSSNPIKVISTGEHRFPSHHPSTYDKK